MRSFSKIPFLVILFMQWCRGENTYCAESVKSVVEVNVCPTTKEERDNAARMKNCEQQASKQKCSTADKFSYHCVINSYRNQTLEVCAPEIIILGHCTEFNVVGGIIQPQLTAPCNNATFPRCDNFYLSSEAYKYQDCYKLVKRTSSIPPTPETSQINFTTSTTFENNTPIPLPDNDLNYLWFLLLPLIIVIGILYCWKKRKHQGKKIIDKEQPEETTGESHSRLIQPLIEAPFSEISDTKPKDGSSTIGGSTSAVNQEDLDENIGCSTQIIPLFNQSNSENTNRKSENDPVALNDDTGGLASASDLEAEKIIQHSQQAAGAYQSDDGEANYQGFEKGSVELSEKTTGNNYHEAFKSTGNLTECDRMFSEKRLRDEYAESTENEELDIKTASGATQNFKESDRMCSGKDLRELTENEELDSKTVSGATQNSKESERRCSEKGLREEYAESTENEELDNKTASGATRNSEESHLHDTVDTETSTDIDLLKPVDKTLLIDSLPAIIEMVLNQLLSGKRHMSVSESPFWKHSQDPEIKEIKEKIHNIEEKQAEIGQLQETIKSLENKVSAIKEECHLLKTEFKEKDNLLTKKNREIELLKKTLNEKEKEINSLKEELQSVKEKYDTMKKKKKQ